MGFAVADSEDGALMAYREIPDSWLNPALSRLPLAPTSR
jgi:hypothetical protein